MPNSKKKILVVDDEPSVCRAIKMMLDCAGHEVHTASSGKEALAFFDSGNFDLVTTDYQMNGMLGDELAVNLKNRRPEIPIIMISGHADSLQFSSRALASVDYILGKPFGIKDLYEAVAHVLQPTLGAES